MSKCDDCVWLTVDRRTAAENICQIMWPSVYVNGLDQVASSALLIVQSIFMSWTAAGVNTELL